MADLFQEVDEAMRAEKWARFWDEHKAAVIVAVAAIILGTGLLSAWTTYRENQNRKATTSIFQAFEQKDAAPALTAAAKNSPADLKALALLNAAAVESKAGHADKAAALYEEASKIKAARSDLTDLAKLQYVSLLIDNPKTAGKDMLGELSPLVKNDQSPWQNEAIFLSAFIKGEKDKNYKLAAQDLKILIAKDTVPPTLKQRAMALASLYANLQEVKK